MGVYACVTSVRQQHPLRVYGQRAGADLSSESVFPDMSTRLHRDRAFYLALPTSIPA